MRRRSIVVAGVLAIGSLAPEAAGAHPVWPDTIPLPTGFQPEGIAVGRGPTFYAGSLATGAVVVGNLRTGEVETLVAGAGGPAVGIEVDARNRVWVAGGPSGEVRVYDGGTGELLELYQGDAGFLNDLVVTRDAVYVTNSFAPALTVVPLGSGGTLPDPGEVTSLPLLGFPDNPGFNANGIEWWPGGALIVAHSSEQALYAVDPASGVATEIDLGGVTLPAADGIILQGAFLYVVQNQLNQIAVVKLDPSLESGEVVAYLTDDDFDVPTTAGLFGNALYAVNARFGTPDPANAAYDVVRVERT